MATDPKTVLCCGCFDPLHYGHVLHLRFARSLGDRLVVALTSDRIVRQNKGRERPRFDEDQRTEMLLECRSVDDVIVYDEQVPYEVIRKVRPAVYVKGKDYVKRYLPERLTVEALGGRVVFSKTQKWSSTLLLEGVCESS